MGGWAWAWDEDSSSVGRERTAPPVPRQHARAGEATDAGADDDDGLVIAAHGGLRSRRGAAARAQPSAVEAKRTDEKRGRRHYV